MRTVLYCLLVLCFTFVKSEDCTSLRFCEDCIRKFGCYWNVGDYNTPDDSGCFPNNNTYLKTIYNPGSTIVLVQNQPISGLTFVRPQKVQLHLRLEAPVSFRVSLANHEESLVLPRHNNVIFQLLRKRPEDVLVSVQAVSCPKDVADFHQVLKLHTTRTDQDISVDVNFSCECPF